MKKLMMIAAGLFITACSLFAQDAQSVKGNWFNVDKTVKMEIYQSGDKYVGKIIWMKDMYEADGRTLKKDLHNPNENLRNRTLVNMVILSGFSYDEGEFSGGEIYDPKSGKTYKGKMKVKSSGLEVRGYVGSPMFGKTKTWTRA